MMDNLILVEICGCIDKDDTIKGDDQNTAEPHVNDLDIERLVVFKIR